MDFVRSLVSGKRRRYVQGGYNLDLTYVRRNLIAMGFPAEGWESCYRNQMSEVYRFLEAIHPQKYKVYNLCAERPYLSNRFNGRFEVFPFEDHCPPPLGMIFDFCQNVMTWLSSNRSNVAVIHCKAGKGRTGVMVSCYYLYEGLAIYARDAMELFAFMRTQDGKGVTLPSQRRYVFYFAELLRRKMTYTPIQVTLQEFRLRHISWADEDTQVMLVISDRSRTIHRSGVLSISSFYCYYLPRDLHLIGDIKVEMLYFPPMRSAKKLFSFWFNTFFARNIRLVGGGGLRHIGNQNVLSFQKNEIENLHKREQQHKLFTYDFEVAMHFLNDVYYFNNY